MLIPEKQLEIWSHQGSIHQSSITYNLIKNVLNAEDTLYANKSFEVFLQGSYRNHTNIFAVSDVDIVIRLDECWQGDLSSLSDDEKEAYQQAHRDVSYGQIQFKKHVVDALSNAYSGDVDESGTAITVTANADRRKADIIAAIQLRRYHHFKSIEDQKYTEGLCFHTENGNSIINYPEQHFVNLTTKHQTTGNKLKPHIRVLKNIRRKLVNDGVIDSGLAPSYFIEGLLYNIPTDKFSNSYHTSLIQAFDWLMNDADLNSLVCANKQYNLLRDTDHNCWSKDKFERFITAVEELWYNW